MKYYVITVFLLVHSLLFSQTGGLKGQLSGWGMLNRVEETEKYIGMRYVPELMISQQLGNGHTVDFVGSLNAYRNGQIQAFDNISSDGEIKLYRLWARYSAANFEVRMGLQKINFGAAMLMRPLMWFDRIDPRDPLQITDGVYSLLLRYYFLNNANIWLWGLYGNNETKGMEFYSPKKDAPEFGGRFQIPLLNGEIAFSVHHRKLSLPEASIRNGHAENRFALDGKWDYGIGFWFEGALSHYKSPDILMKYQQMVTLGVDYTLDVGNGLHFLGEHFLLHRSEKYSGAGESYKLAALLVDYPLTLLDQFAGILYYDWQSEQFYRFFNITRTYDNWSIHLLGFWNPEQQLFVQSGQQQLFMMRRGFQIMVVYNH